ncbi:double zinc ribbon and ankyrin repeat-containing protein 1 [Stigmatopora nigra]
MAVLAPRIIPIMHWEKPASKNHLDSRTPVCIQSDTSGTQVFYTLDGSRPQWASPGSGGRRYVAPFPLPAGRVCVRAVAVTSDGRESATVTKAFVVREAPPGPPACEEALNATSVASSANPGFLRRSQWWCATCGAPLPRRVMPPVDGQKVRCVLCDTQVPTEAGVGISHAVAQVSPDRELPCSECRRGNRVNARYCDWCGAKVHVCSETATAVATYETCTGCGAAVPPQAANCAVCGLFLDAPPPSSLRTATSSCQTQTSPVALRRAEPVSAEHPPTSRRDRPPLAAISPGRGYWRQQVDHVCAHLRSFAQNDAPFRTLLGEPRLGRMISAVLRKDAGEVNLILSFNDVERRARRDADTGRSSAGPPVSDDVSAAHEF